MKIGLDYRQIRWHLAAILKAPQGTVIAAQRVLRALPLSDAARHRILKDLLEEQRAVGVNPALFLPPIFSPSHQYPSLSLEVGPGDMGKPPSGLRCTQDEGEVIRYSRRLAVDKTTFRIRDYEFRGPIGREIVALIAWIDRALKNESCPKGRSQKSVFTETLQRQNGMGITGERRSLIERELLEILRAFQGILQEGGRIDTLHAAMAVTFFHFNAFEEKINQLPPHRKLWATCLKEISQGLEKQILKIDADTREATSKNQQHLSAGVNKLERKRERIILYTGVLDFILRLEKGLEGVPSEEQTQIRKVIEKYDEALRKVVLDDYRGVGRACRFREKANDFQSFIVQKCKFRF